MLELFVCFKGKLSLFPNVKQWVQVVRISSFLNHIHIRLKEKTVEKSLFFHRHCIQRHFIMTFEMIFGAKNLLHHVMITHVRALAISSSSSPLYRVIMADD